jgi:NitT/TauT family transport system ATP-binding protein
VNKWFAVKGERVQVLRDVDLEVRQGEFLSLVGPSGCGKSTLLNMLAGLDQPDEGVLELEGQPLRAAGDGKVMVFQEAALFPWLTVQQNVEFGLQMASVPAAQRSERALEHLRLVHLSRYASAYPHELSGGMKQRVAIARALVMEPHLLLMDEPFGALDEQTRSVLQDELQRIWLQTRKTVVFVTHSLAEAVLLSDRVALFSARPGRILKVFEVEASHPRSDGDPNLLLLRNEIKSLLSDEVTALQQKEMDSDWTAEKGDLPTDMHRYLGSNI